MGCRQTVSLKLEILRTIHWAWRPFKDHKVDTTFRLSNTDRTDQFWYHNLVSIQLKSDDTKYGQRNTGRTTFIAYPNRVL